MPIWSPAFFGSATSGFVVEDSVYFDGTADRLTFDPSGASSTPDLYCISYWAKRTGFGATHYNVMSGGANGYDSTLRYTNYSSYQEAIQFYANGGPDNLITNAAFRDPTAWHHVFARYDSNASGGSSDYMQLWVNGVRLTSFASSSMPSAGENSTLFDGNIIAVGGYNHSATQWFDGYLAEVAASDGQDHAATDFGEYDDDGVWVPKDITGLTYGTNGFLLQFKQTGSGQDASGIGADTSGNNNHFAIAGGSPQSQQVTDTCTDNAASDIGNYATLNPLDLGSSTALSEGNLRCTSGSNFFDNNYAFSTIAMDSDKFYVTSLPTDTGKYLGIANASVTTDIATANDVHIYWDSSAPRMVYWNGSNNNLTPSPTEVRGTDQFGIALNATNGDYWIGWYDISGSAWYWYNSSAGNWTGNPDSDSGKSGTLSGGPYRFMIGCNASGTHDVDFGQGSLWNNITELTNFKKLNTANLPAPTVTDPRKYFGILTWRGNNTENTEVKAGETIDGQAVGGALKDKGGTGTSWTPDFAWIKNRTDSSTSWVMADAVRTATRNINSDTDAAQDIATRTISFLEGGIEVGDSNFTNKDDKQHVGYFWKAGGAPSVDNSGGQTPTNNSVMIDGVASTSSISTPGSGTNIYPKRASINNTANFAIITHTNQSGDYAVCHGASFTPTFLMQKGLGSQGWLVWTDKLGGNNKYLSLSSTGATQDPTADPFHDDAPTVQTFSNSGTDWYGGGSFDIVTYLFDRVPGYCAHGTYTGNTTTLPYVVLDDSAFGFRPAWIMVKRTDSTEGWHINDAARDPINPLNLQLQPNTSAGESGSSYMDFTANGFKLRGTQGATNANTGTYIYLAFAEHPFGGDGVAQAKAR